jgi:hypothetical protein
VDSGAESLKVDNAISMATDSDRYACGEKWSTDIPMPPNPPFQLTPLCDERDRRDFVREKHLE